MSEQLPPPKPSAFQHTKSVGKSIGKAGSSFRSAVNSIDNISISRHGLSTKKELSAGNVGYDRANYVAAPRRDASHFAPPPKRAVVMTPSSSSAAAAPNRPVASARPPVASPPPALHARAGPPLPAAKSGSLARPAPTPPMRATGGGRPVPPPPPARKQATGEEGLPAYTPVPASNGMLGDLSSRLNGLSTSTPAPPAVATPPATGSSRLPSKAEASSAFKSAGTVSSLYGKYGNTSTTTGSSKAAPTPSWQDVKAGAAAANDLRGFAGKYAPKTTPAQREKAIGFGNRVLASQGQATMPVGAIHALSGTTTATNVVVGGAPPLPAGKPGLPARTPHVPTCTALFTFDGQQPDDLSFVKGDVIEILDRTDDPEAWWRGRCQGRVGLFPGNYCRLNV
ncbi:hypothetical protein BCR37DRAFT_104175 [Protomyces lactucae-debilis]|uniref:SH3 domain-containing protein n=1 Tax=Protomyces lactucae-debilis TaxID=2754530 RepID=A0A1Y2F6I5_PROLT|nr:uncharacterized protein BCR37DRAFT_104175 [Protomyces lactucae-debilis]ORY79094.1 hypothetical protein BCR37DRAFT_104175 [Protomyces lactucae-debilis]